MNSITYIYYITYIIINFYPNYGQANLIKNRRIRLHVLYSAKQLCLHISSMVQY